MYVSSIPSLYRYIISYYIMLYPRLMWMNQWHDSCNWSVAIIVVGRRFESQLAATRGEDSLWAPRVSISLSFLQPQGPWHRMFAQRQQVNTLELHFRVGRWTQDAIGVVEGMTPLLCAVFAEDLDLVRVLVQPLGSDVWPLLGIRRWKDTE